MRASRLFLPTLRDDPADAEAASHKLLVRGGFIRQVSAGLWTFLPLGWRVHRKIEQIIREEMDAIGGQEMLMPLLTPAELWETTGRIAIPEVFHIEDRSGRRLRAPHDARGDGDVPLARAPVVQASCRSSGTTSPSRIATSRGLAAGSSDARVHHEGCIFVRS